MKIYTKTGDDGSTGLSGGARLPKSDPRIDCYGTVDELNAAIGLAVVTAPPTIKDPLTAVQHELFVIGALLSLPPPGAPAPSRPPPALNPATVTRLETQIDAAERTLTPLTQFILPGGSETAARLHLARTICRRAERRLVALAATTPIQSLLITYLNRLSDWLFVQARLANHLASVPDIPWQKPPA